VVQGTFDNFNQEVLQSPLPVLVEFYATWCPHCAVMSPAVLQFAQDYAGQVKVVQVDYDAQPALDSTYGITGLPTCIFFVNGTETEEQAIGSDDTSAEDEAVLIDLFGELP
jgi:thioredoxin